MAQFSVVKLLDQAPYIPATIGSAFMNSKLNSVNETTFDGREFKRVKSWEPAYDLKKFSETIESYLSKIEKRSEDNSFSLNYAPLQDEELLQYLRLMKLSTDSLYKIWKSYSKQIAAVCPEFFVLSDDYGCDEIAASGHKLNDYAARKNQIFEQARKDMRGLFDLVQRYFNKLYLIEDPMTNNEVMSQISIPLQILQEWDHELNVANYNMVETGISLNNALCGKN